MRETSWAALSGSRPPEDQGLGFPQEEQAQQSLQASDGQGALVLPEKVPPARVPLKQPGFAPDPATNASLAGPLPGTAVVIDDDVPNPGPPGPAHEGTTHSTTEPQAVAPPVVDL